MHRRGGYEPFILIALQQTHMSVHKRFMQWLDMMDRISQTWFEFVLEAILLGDDFVNASTDQG